MIKMYHKIIFNPNCVFLWRMDSLCLSENHFDCAVKCIDLPLSPVSKYILKFCRDKSNWISFFEAFTQLNRRFRVFFSILSIYFLDPASLWWEIVSVLLFSFLKVFILQVFVNFSDFLSDSFCYKSWFVAHHIFLDLFSSFQLFFSLYFRSCAC